MSILKTLFKRTAQNEKYSRQNLERRQKGTFTPEEIAESDLRVALIGELINTGEEKQEKSKRKRRDNPRRFLSVAFQGKNPYNGKKQGAKMNNGNLKPIQKGGLTKSEAKRRGKNGGKKSGEARRERKALKERLLLLLETGDTAESVAVALINKALSGNVRAFEVIRDTIGEKPVDKVAQTDGSGKDIPRVIEIKFV